ncbi:MAG: AzlC family ABC transporter permease [Oceanospirillaceae bacterium]
MGFSIARQQFWQGAKDLLPLASGVVPFGLITGANGVALGMPIEQVIAMTILFYAGSAQLITYQLIQDNAAFFMIFLTSIVINLRFAIYSMALSPLISPLAKRYRFPLAYLLSDQAYALSSMPEKMQQNPTQRLWYYVGAAFNQWFIWVVSVIAGTIIGVRIPEYLSLEFTIPLAFLAMLVSTISNRQLFIVALISGSCAAVAQFLPYNLGFIVAVTSGVLAGLMLSHFITVRGVN